VELTDDERMQIEAACRADTARGWSGIFPDRHCINAEVERIKAATYAAGRAAGLAEAEEAIRELRPGPERDGEPGSWRRGDRHGRLRSAEVIAKLRKGGE
jgi:hypothetical protein